MNGILVDTTVLIDLSRGDSAAADYIDAAFSAGASLFVSVVSAMELIAGCRDNQDVRRAERLIAEFALLQITPSVSSMAFDLMLSFSKSHGLAIPDAFIAAGALMQELELASDNERHFAMIPGLVVNRPY